MGTLSARSATSYSILIESCHFGLAGNPQAQIEYADTEPKVRVHSVDFGTNQLLSASAN
jgi:hypothetical protein